MAGAVAVRVEHALARDLAFGREMGLVHAHATFGAGVGSVGELVDHHPLEDVRSVISY